MTAEDKINLIKEELEELAYFSDILGLPGVSKTLASEYTVGIRRGLIIALNKVMEIINK